YPTTYLGSSSPSRASSPQPPLMPTMRSIMCEVCGTYFETRRGLSSHARLHLRKLGVTVSESSGAPIELLYQITRERYGSLPDFKSDSFLHVSVPQKLTLQQESKPPPEEEDTNTTYKTGVGLVTTSQMVDHQGSAANLNESSASVLPSTPPPVKPAEGSSSSSSERTAAAKPLWAPRETDAPITLGMTGLNPSDEVYVCELCGCWYETRKGLASHARAHLRQIGISDSDIKGSPIDLLYQIMEEEDLKPVDFEKKEELPSNSPPRSSSKRPSTQSPPPESSSSKRPKISEECTCILCGEEFENRKGLASHARSHLRHIGMSELVGKNSAIDAVQDLVTQSSGPSQSWTPFSSTPLSTNPEKISQSPQAPVNRAPKAKKGFRLAVDPLHRKPKPEPVETEVSVQLKASTSESTSTDVPSPPTVLCEFCGQLFDTRKALSCHARAHLRQLGLTWSIKTSPIDLLKEVMMHGEEGRKELSVRGSTASGKDCIILRETYISDSTGLNTSCELCGFDFENRKALASHARAHLRQLGIIEWKADGATSPIELLSELIKRDPAKVSEITKRYRMGDLYIKKVGYSDSVVGSSLKLQSNINTSLENQNRNSQQPPRSGNIPALLPKPPLTPLVKLVGKIYSLKCRFCEEVFQGPLSVQEQWITHLQKHILSLGCKDKTSPPATPVTTPALVHPVAV
uniref:WIZ zinc finger a n=1 Tax=Amphilophus citrinellus TaxID=61819 RepID=A0A3Q0RFT8_AMPCI